MLIINQKVQWQNLRWNLVILAYSISLFFVEVYNIYKILPASMSNIFIISAEAFLVFLVSIDFIIRAFEKKSLKNELFYLIASSIFLLAYFAFFISIKINQGLFVPVTAYHALLAIRACIIHVSALNRDYRTKTYIEQLFLNPAQVLSLSFAIIIFFGSIFLYLPISQEFGVRINYTDALFLSVSAVCVTGLSPLNIATHLSLVGEIILLLLIQIGGLGILLLSFVIFSSRKSSSSNLQRKALLTYMLSDDDMHNITKYASTIVKSTFIIEFLGAIFIFFSLAKNEGYTFHTAYIAIFHSISAFCNAGFSLYSSLEILSTNVFFNIDLILLIIMGGLGFTTIVNLKRSILNFYHNITHNNGSHRRNTEWTLNTHIVVKGTIFMIIGGVIIFYILEHRGVLEDFSTGHQYLVALFQSVTARTAGFNTIDFSMLHLSTLLFFMVWMYVGGSSGGIAGGVKINTVVLCFAGFIGFFQNRDRVNIRNYTIDGEEVRKSFMIMLFSLIVISGITFILSITEIHSFERLLFEAVSAFSTTGLSTGITSTLSESGKYLIMILMFLGRIGPLTIFSVVKEIRKNKNSVEYATGQIMVG